MEWSLGSVTEWRPSAHSTRWATPDGSATVHPRGGLHSMPRCPDAPTPVAPTLSPPMRVDRAGRDRQPGARTGRGERSAPPTPECPPADTCGRCPPFSPLHPLDQVHRTSSAPLDRPRLHPLTTGRGTCCFPLTSARVKGKPGGRSPCITRSDRGAAPRPAAADPRGAVRPADGRRSRTGLPPERAPESTGPRAEAMAAHGHQAEYAVAFNAMDEWVGAVAHRVARVRVDRSPRGGSCPSTRCAPSDPVDGAGPVRRSPSTASGLHSRARWKWGAPIHPTA